MNYSLNPSSTPTHTRVAKPTHYNRTHTHHSDVQHLTYRVYVFCRFAAFCYFSKNTDGIFLIYIPAYHLTPLNEIHEFSFGFCDSVGKRSGPSLAAVGYGKGSPNFSGLTTELVRIAQILGFSTLDLAMNQLGFGLDPDISPDSKWLRSALIARHF
jgi:hypothetical protein